MRRGTLTIGALPTLAPYLLSVALVEFLEKFPGVETVVQEDTIAQLLKLADGCEIDFALASQPIRGGRLEVKELFSDELSGALPPGHPLTRKRTVAVAGLKAAVGHRHYFLPCRACVATATELAGSRFRILIPNNPFWSGSWPINCTG